jgi:hypothetical protein
VEIPRDLIQGNEQAKLLAHLALSIVPEIRCSRIPELQEENVVEQCLVQTTSKSLSADPHLATALEVSKEIMVKSPSQMWCSGLLFKILLHINLS